MDDTKLNNTKKIFDASQEDLKKVGIFGTEWIKKMQKKYSPFQLKMMEERAKFLKLYNSREKKLKFWEYGFNYFFPVFLGLTCAISVLSYHFADKILDFISSFKIFSAVLDKKVITSLVVTSLTLSTFQICDIGRIIIFYRKYYKKGLDEDSSVLILSRIEPGEFSKNGTEKKGSNWLSTSEISEGLDIDMSPQNLGKVMKNLGFSHRKTKKNNQFLIKKVNFAPKNDHE